MKGSRVVDELKSATGSSKQSHKDSDGRAELCLIRLRCLVNMPVSLLPGCWLLAVDRPTYVYVFLYGLLPTLSCICIHCVLCEMSPHKAVLQTNFCLLYC